jgi:hypothetical protein
MSVGASPDTRRKDATMSGPSWTLRIELPEPEGGAALHLTVVLETQGKPAGITRGRSLLWARYRTEAEAREAMGFALAARPLVRCSVAAIPALAG